jgi:hypothetical protein
MMAFVSCLRTLIFRCHIPMKCPHCKNKAIGFLEWGQGLNAFSTICQNCGIRLKATKGTYIAALVCFMVLLGMIFILAPIFEKEGMSRFSFRHGIMAIAVVVVGGVASRFCGYRTAEEDTGKRSGEDSD